MAALPIIVLWMVITYDSSSNVPDDPVVYHPFGYRLYLLVTQSSGLDAFSPLITPLVTGAVLVLPLLAGARPSRRPERWLPFVLGLLAFMIAPHYVFSAAYFYQRLGVFLVPLWLLAWDPPRADTRRADWVAMLVVVAWALANASRFAAFARESQTFEEAMRGIEPGRRMASMIYDSRTPLFTLPVYMHFAHWYQAEHRGVVDFNFADFYSQVARYRPEAGARLPQYLAWRPDAFRWDVHGGASYDYFIVKASVDVSNEIFKDKRGSVELVRRSGWWWLYRNIERRSSESGGATTSP